ncbi:MAG: type II secretion system F family protein [Deltaproteobacteria bacterium]
MQMGVNSNSIAIYEKVQPLSAQQFLVILIIYVMILAISYYIIDIIEKSKVKKLTKPKFIYLKTSFLNKYIDKLFEVPIIEKYLKRISGKLSYFNSYDARVNYRNALLLSIVIITTSIIMFTALVVMFKASIWYLYLLYIIVIVLIIYISLNFYGEMKELKLAKQLPEALNDLKIAYDNKKRLKLAILEAYDDMPKDIRREFARLAESDNLEESIIFLRNRVKNDWFKIVLTLMLLAVQKGDKEGALSDQLQNLNGIISQEILIKESNRLMFQLYKIFVLASPLFAFFLRNNLMAMSDDIAKLYQSVNAANALSGIFILCIIAYFVLDTFEKI